MGLLARLCARNVDSTNADLKALPSPYEHPPDKQPYIFWIVRLGCYAQLKGKSIDHAHHIQTLI